MAGTGRQRLTRRVLVAVAVVDLLVAGVLVASRVREPNEAAAIVEVGAPAAASPGPVTTPDLLPSDLVAPAPSTTVPPPPPPATFPPEPEPPPASLRTSVTPYVGLGTWIDVFDWAVQYAGPDGPSFGPADVDRMADLGVQTLFVQAARFDAPTDVVEPELLLPILARARERGIRLVAWYLPTHEDPEADLRRLLAVASLDVDGLAVNIESTRLPDAAERSRRAVDLSATLRAALPDQVISAVPLPPVVMEVLNGSYWPGFPWAELAPYYDVWLPMAYWTNRAADSPYRDAYVYTAENIDRMRANLGNAGAVCHALGGIGDKTTAADIAGMAQAAAERGCIGGSLYDYRTTSDEVWSAVQALRS